ncbi:hypothetical protein OC25_10920 [Pedobacter kyungheensis]|uniref:Uncharacterized protein n=1 Tax=Pedobacter kyungheensis TaxID=1069985 RepID=A0A0C1DJJ1_9SPHI|nr:hypothetical protein OC25_10920 [Pedobacter kyungheensis]
MGKRSAGLTAKHAKAGAKEAKLIASYFSVLSVHPWQKAGMFNHRVHREKHQGHKANCIILFCVFCASVAKVQLDLTTACIEKNTKDTKPVASYFSVFSLNPWLNCKGHKRLHAFCASVAKNSAYNNPDF